LILKKGIRRDESAVSRPLHGMPFGAVLHARRRAAKHLESSVGWSRHGTES
jgi:hypothetical protein